MEDEKWIDLLEIKENEKKSWTLTLNINLNGYTVAGLFIIGYFGIFWTLFMMG